MRFLSNGKPLILPNGKPSHADCCCGCCTNLPETLYLTLDQFTIQPSWAPFLDCDPFYMCNDGDFSITSAPGAPTGQPGNEIAFSTGNCTDATPGAENGPPVNVAALKIRCAKYADGVSRWYVHSIGGVPILTGRYADCTFGGFPQFGLRNCIFTTGHTGAPLYPDIDPPVFPIFYNIIGPTSSCSPFYLQGTAKVDFWVTPTAAIFVDRCERVSTIRFTVTE